MSIIANLEIARKLAEYAAENFALSDLEMAAVFRSAADACEQHSKMELQAETNKLILHRLRKGF